MRFALSVGITLYLFIVGLGVLACHVLGVGAGQ
jgi:hypothetical protein